MPTRTKMVNNRGKRLRLLSCHRVLNSSLRFFFMTMARRKGEIHNTVMMPVMALAYQCSSQPGSSLRVNGSRKVNMTAMTAEERML